VHRFPVFGEARKRDDAANVSRDTRFSTTRQRLASFSCRSARNQNAHGRPRQLRQSRKFIVAVNLSASAIPLEWPVSLFPLSPFLSLSLSLSTQRISRPFNRGQLDRHKPGTVLGSDVILVRAHEQSMQTERRKEQRRARVRARNAAVDSCACLPFAHNGADCLSQDRRIHESSSSCLGDGSRMHECGTQVHPDINCRHCPG